MDTARIRRWGRIAALAIAVGLILYRYQRAMDAHWREQLAIANRVIQTQDAVLDSLAKVRAADTVRLVKWQTKYVAVRDTVLLRLQDTVPLPPDTVRIVIQAADSTVQACRLVLRDCDAQRVALQTQVTALQSAMHAVKPRWYVVWGERIAWAGVGYKLSQASKR